MIYIIFVSLTFQVLGAVLAYFKMHRNGPYMPRVAPITILKPIKGIDKDFATCIRSFLTTESIPGDEIIFCFDSKDDPAYEIVRDLAGDDKRCRFLTNPTTGFANPKINNIFHGYNNADNDLILISDSNVIARHDYLRMMEDTYNSNPGTGVATSVVYALGHSLDAAMLNTFNAKWILILNFVGQSTVVGKSMLFSQRRLEKVGGLMEAGEYLAEDYAIGSMFKEAGFRISITPGPVLQTCVKNSFWDRYVRWGIMRKAHAPIAFAFEPLVYGFVTQLCAGFFMSWYSAMLLGFIWSGCDMIICKSVSGSPLYLLPYTIREWSAVPMWFETILSRTITWKGKDYVVRWGGKATAKIPN